MDAFASGANSGHGRTYRRVVWHRARCDVAPAERGNARTHHRVLRTTATAVRNRLVEHAGPGVRLRPESPLYVRQRRAPGDVGQDVERGDREKLPRAGL